MHGSICRLRVEREIRIHTGLSHPGIVKLISSFEDDSRFYLVLELLPGDLFKMLITRGQIDEEGTLLDVLVPLLEALVYIHDQVRTNGRKLIKSVLCYPPRITQVSIYFFTLLVHNIV